MFVPSELRDTNPFFYNELSCCKNSELNEIVNMYFSDLVTLAVSRFLWRGLPNSIPPWYLEYLLFWFGACIMEVDEVDGELIYGIRKVALGGNPDNYGIPEIRYGYTENGKYFNAYSKLNSVLCYDNYGFKMTANTCYIYAKRCANAHMTTDMNLVAHRTPLVGIADALEKLTNDSIKKQYFDFVPIIELKGMSGEDLERRFKVLNLNAPVVFDKSEMVKESSYSDCLMKLGIESFWKDKAERLTQQESAGYNGLIEMERNSYLLPRKNFCRQVNELFGLNLSVEFNSDLPTQVNYPEAYLTQMTGGEMGGTNIHNTSTDNP